MLGFHDTPRITAYTEIKPNTFSDKVGVLVHTQILLYWHAQVSTGTDIFCTSMGLERQIVKELDLKLTLGMAER